MHANTFAARAGRWSAQHRKTAIWGWIAFVAIAFVIGGAVGVKKPTDYIGPGDSGRADQLALDHFPKDDVESILVQAPKGGSAKDANVRKAVDDVDRRRLGQAARRRGQVALRHGQREPDRQGRPLRPRELQGPRRRRPRPTKRDRPRRRRGRPRQGASNPDVYVGEFGDASANKALSKSF